MLQPVRHDAISWPLCGREARGCDWSGCAASGRRIPRAWRASIQAPTALATIAGSASTTCVTSIRAMTSSAACRTDEITRCAVADRGLGRPRPARSVRPAPASIRFAALVRLSPIRSTRSPHGRGQRVEAGSARAKARTAPRRPADYALTNAARSTRLAFTGGRRPHRVDGGDTLNSCASTILTVTAAIAVTRGCW